MQNFGKNGHIITQLDNYLKAENTEHAVLLTGGWGTGKTYLVNKYIELYRNANPKTERKICYVSLFDTVTLEDIDKAILANTNMLFNERAQNVGRLGSFIFDKFKLAIPYGTEANKAIDFAKNLITDVLAKSLNNISNGLIIIFDDVERTTIPIKQILGYCNNLITQNKAQLILLADETKINESDDYREFKEKIIGKTIQLEPDMSTLYDNFINEASISTETKEALIRNKKFVLDKCMQHEFKNLRLLKSIISEADIFMESISQITNDNKELAPYIDSTFDDIFLALFILTYIINMGILRVDKVGSFTSEHFKRNIRKHSARTKEELKKVKPKTYDAFTGYFFTKNTPFGLWKYYFSGKMIYYNIAKLHLTSVQNSDKFPEAYANTFQINHQQFEKLYQSLKNGVDEHRYNDVFTILSVSEKYLYWCDLEIIDEKSEDVLAKLVGYINNISITDEDVEKYRQDKRFVSDMFFGEEFSENRQTIIDTIHQRLDQHIQDKYETLAEELYNATESAKILDVLDDIYRKYDGSFLYTIDSEKFVDIIVDMPDRRSILNVIARIAEKTPHNDDKCTSCEWLKKFRDHIFKKTNNTFDEAIFKLLLDENTKPFETHKYQTYSTEK